MSIGISRPRADAPGKVTGDELYPADLAPADPLWARVVFSDQPHARMTEIDVSAAEAADGVVMVLTAKDVPVNEYGLTMFDQPVLVGLDDTGAARVAADVSRWEADQIAVVVAETADQAAAAADLIDVAWEPLPVVPDLEAALTDGTLVHPETEAGSNAYVHYRSTKGDPSAAWEQADVIVEGTYRVPHQEHAFLQPEAAVGYVDDDGRVTVQVAGQWTYEDRMQIAHALDLPDDRIRVIYPAIGGAFGGREDMSFQIVLALAAWRLDERLGIRRPIKAQWSREESIVGHHKRHRGVIHTKWGATRDGDVVAAVADAYLDAGAYNYTTNKVLGNLHLTVLGPYEIPHVAVDSYGVYTNTVPGGAFRGFGAPQGAFVAESQMNRLAAELGMDPVELRLRNGFREGSGGITGHVLPEGVSLPEVIAACVGEAGWVQGAVEQPKPDAFESFTSFQTLAPDPNAVRTGRGFACAYKNIGFSFGFPERCEAIVELHGSPRAEEPEHAVLFHGAAEVGQGTHTALRQMTAEAIGIDPDRVSTEFSDTATSGDSGSVSASRMTWMAGNSIQKAVKLARKNWDNGDRPATGVAEGEEAFRPPETGPLNATGEPSERPPNFAYGYVAEAVEVAVDVETGHIAVGRVVCATDVGKAINPMLIEGQVEGAVVQAHGYAVTEHLQMRDARITNPRLSGYLIPGIGDIPERVTTVILEHPDPLGPWGARGMAEMPFIPLAPALVHAIHDATGVWFTEFPLTPDRVVAELRRQGAGI